MNDKLHLRKQGREKKNKGKVLGLLVNQPRKHIVSPIVVLGRKAGVALVLSFTHFYIPSK